MATDDTLKKLGSVEKRRGRTGSGGGLRDGEPEHVYRLREAATLWGRQDPGKRRHSNESSWKNCKVMGQDRNGGLPSNRKNFFLLTPEASKTGAGQEVVIVGVIAPETSLSLR